MGLRLIEPKSYINLDLDARIEIFSKASGIPALDLHALSYENEKASVDERLVELSLRLYTSLVEQGHEKYFALSHLTQGILGLILCHETECEWDKSPGRSLLRAIKRTFHGYAVKLNEETGYSFNDISGLRKWVYEQNGSGKFNPNVESAVNEWGDDIFYSKFDLVKGVKLPSQIDSETAFFLGVAYFGHYNPYANLISLGCKDSLSPFFDNVVARIAEDKFHVHLRKRRVRDRGLEYTTSSLLFSSWLSSRFGYEGNIESQGSANLDDIPDERMIDRDAAKQFFLYGLIARRGRIQKLKYNDFRMVLSVGINAPDATEYVGSLTKELGYGGAVNTDLGIVFFTRGDCQRIMQSKLPDSYNFSYPHIGGFVNPEHLKKVLSISYSASK